MNWDEIWNLAWLHNRLVNHYKESPNVDFVVSLRTLIVRRLNESHHQLKIVNTESGMIEFRFSGNQP